MDFALQQLIADTGDVRSALRGHSLARDMYGNDASEQRLPRFPPGRPSSPRAPITFFYITGVAKSGPARSTT